MTVILWLDFVLHLAWCFQQWRLKLSISTRLAGLWGKATHRGLHGLRRGYSSGKLPAWACLQRPV
jgi:hypothetical protein